MTDNDTINSKQIAAWLVDARHVTRTADESSDEYAAARAISTLGLALLGTSGEHGDFTGWTGAEGNGYRELVAAADGWVPDGYLVGRFKILAWQLIIKPDFPLGAQ
ncbi:hypothetical protein QB704_002746 [Salmonella enterica]|nr:hypothetical protein [Salmonella enterica]EKS4960620.1 hypothetical protein [Salmonella enterica]EKS4979370.1 hypothetical protein [Salmonella enterica]